MKEVFLEHRRQACAVLLLALTLRLFFVFVFPHVGGDSPMYETFARNLIRFRIYSDVDAQNQALPPPALSRPPGYPFFLATVFFVAGERNETAVRIVQAVLDTVTCLLISILVFEISSGEIHRRRRSSRWALLLAAVCPFVGNYAASILTEVPTTFFLTAATLLAVKGFKNPAQKWHWFTCGLLIGVATLFRPESGLWLAAIGLVFVVCEGKLRQWRFLFFGGSLMTLGLLVALFPWTARNWITLKTFQPLVPTYPHDPNEVVPQGYLDWCKTWLWKFQEVSAFIWPIEEAPIPIDALPSRSADNQPQRDKIRELLLHYNETTSLDQSTDDQFEAIAQERRRHRFRYYLLLPALRSAAMWFTPRVEVVPLEGKLLPIRAAWENDPRDFLLTLLLFVANLVYVALAVIGAYQMNAPPDSSNHPELLFLFLLLTLILVRTIFFAYFAFPEPRYVVEAYPAVIALGAFAFSKRST